MPSISYKCKSCGKVTDKLVRPRDLKGLQDVVPCSFCGAESVRRLGTPSSVSKIIVDDGSQPRAVEIMPDVIELMKNRKEDRGPV